MAEEVAIIQASSAVITPGATWQPHVGEALCRVLETVPDPDRTRDETLGILGRGITPAVGGSTAGLVVGYVQSGKTTSFTATAAAARDNGFALVIVIAGTSTNLQKQTEERLHDALALGERDAYRRWVHFSSPRPNAGDVAKFAAALDDWVQEDPHDRATVLVTVMKQHQHLEWLRDVIAEAAKKVQLTETTALIIDDEADQASPNIKREGESPTYARIGEIRRLLPNHTLLEYTATPQAPLLVSLADAISPEFVCVIDPGEAYTGGQYFFQQHHDSFIEHIPPEDIDGVEDAIDVPRSLRSAFATFALGCAAGPMLGSEPSQRSMLVHPSQKTLPHERFVNWIDAMKENFASLLLQPAEDRDRADLVAHVLQPAYDDLARTVPELPSLEALTARMPQALRKTTVREVNATRGKAPEINWSTGYAWVLVGGTLLDRGFTIEGLTVTYMPRGVGVGNADTVQQRARFFGYKKSYAGFCRAWLDPDVASAFTGYVDHEEAMRAELTKVARSGRSLKDWQRFFLLDPKMRPTRSSVVRLDLDRWTFNKEWIPQRSFAGATEATYTHNRRVIDQFVERHTFVEDNSARDVMQAHAVAEVALADVLKTLLRDYVMTDEDADRFAHLRVLLAVVADEQPRARCEVHLMAHGSWRSERRRRSVDEHQRIKSLFQGANPRTGYRGDREIRDANCVTIQIHRLDLRSDDGTDEGRNGAPLASDVPVLAIRIPESIDMSVVAER